MKIALINKTKNENLSDLFCDFKIDKVLDISNGVDFTEFSKGDLILFKDVSSVAESKEEFMNFCVVIRENGIDFVTRCIDTRSFHSKFIIDMMITVWDFLEKTFELKEEK